MSSISFEKLQAANDWMNDTYWVWVGGAASASGAYVTWNATAGTVGTTTVTLSDAIAPMQSIIVEKDPEAAATSMNLDLVTLSASDNAGTRMAKKSSGILEMIASTPQAAVRAAIAFHEDGSRVFNRKDSRRVSEGINLLPDLYMLKPGKGNSVVPVTANILNEVKEDVMIPLAIATTYEGPITLSFAGMDTYNARIFFIDNEATNNKETELTGESRYEYTFDYAPKTVNGAVAANENRFMIRLSSNATGLGSATPNRIMVYSREANTIHVASAEPIQQVSVFNVQGQKMYDRASINASEHTVSGLAAGIYLVKVASKNELKTVKVIVK
jgi:hypothetical protein